MTLKEHIKKQKEECLKYKVNSDNFNEHWDLLNFLCELAQLRNRNAKLLELVVKNGLIDEL